MSDTPITDELLARLGSTRLSSVTTQYANDIRTVIAFIRQCERGPDGVYLPSIARERVVKYTSADTGKKGKEQ